MRNRARWQSLRWHSSRYYCSSKYIKCIYFKFKAKPRSPGSVDGERLLLGHWHIFATLTRKIICGPHCWQHAKQKRNASHAAARPIHCEFIQIQAFRLKPTDKKMHSDDIEIFTAPSPRHLKNVYELTERKDIYMCSTRLETPNYSLCSAFVFFLIFSPFLFLFRGWKIVLNVIFARDLDICVDSATMVPYGRAHVCVCACACLSLAPPPLEWYPSHVEVGWRTTSCKWKMKCVLTA